MKRKIPKPKPDPIIERGGYPSLWTDYLTVGELRARLADPMLMDGDLTNVTEVRRAVGGFAVVIENDATREGEE